MHLAQNLRSQQCMKIITVLLNMYAYYYNKMFAIYELLIEE
jgi:hypothetical protein